MYIANNETAISSRGILNFMPRGIRRYMYNINLDGACEIHMRLGKPLCIHYADGCFYVNHKGNLTALPTSAVRVTREHIDEALEIATSASVYSVKEEIKNGFLTIAGGHRIGITGTAVIKEDKVSFIKDISALNYRLAGEVIGAADEVMPMILDGGGIRNTLIISPPGAGKTTMLRDIVRQLSYKSYRISVVDERREVAALCEGRSAFDLGFSTDVLEGADKAEGMLMVLRSMSPDVIVTDEIGKQEDIDAVEKITNSGAAVIATIHGRNIEMIKRRDDLRRMLMFFNLIITLSKRSGIGTVEEALLEW
ncbi:MAG: Flp pilus assembly complex ATPase component TadA [Oscillospiraceae bacterium]|nr:Flp pilus assembly complex ATPase component TadA [Oscillospiraceae bacterium]